MSRLSTVPTLALVLGTLLSSLPGCSGGLDASMPASAAGAAEVAPFALSAVLLARARRHHDDAVAHGLAAGWRGATLGEARPLYRPDVDGVAYVEVEVVHAGAPAGFIVLATGEHDYPIVEWNTHGTRPTERVRERARSEGREVLGYYRLDLSTVAATAEGDLVAGEDDAASADIVVSAKREASPDQRAFADALRASAHEAWLADARAATDPGAGARFGGASHTSDVSCVVNESRAAPLYNQLHSYEPPSSRWFWSGCGATAWMMMIGWADMQADDGDPKWAGLKALYRQGGSADPNTPDARAPHDFDWGSRVMTDAIASTLGTWGAPDATEESSGVTEPWRMSRITDFLNDWGMGGSVIATTFDWGGGQFDSLRDRAVDLICNDQQAAVVGIGALSHYALATETWYGASSGTRYFWLDMGHGGYDNAWYAPGVFFAGSLRPRYAGPLGAGATGLEIGVATYGGSVGGRTGNASQHMSNVCNNQSSCSYYVSTVALGDPAPGRAKTFEASYRCSGTDVSRYVYLPGEANNHYVNLTCPTINVATATYGGNCGVAAGHNTSWVRAVCNGRTQCHLEIDYRVIGDPAPGCAKDFVAQYQCGGGAMKTATVPPEAGFNKVLDLSCP
jgi:hypothetical protein